MINERICRRYCCEDISGIPNYHLAIADKKRRWEIHHELETIENISYLQLIEDGRYYNRPANELIFMTKSAHMRLHMKYKTPWNKGKKTGPVSEETRNKHRETSRGEKNGFYGRHHSDRTKAALREKRLGIIPANSRRVEQINLQTGEVCVVYDSIAEAHRKTGCSHISSVCSGSRRQAGGYGWRYT